MTEVSPVELESIRFGRDWKRSPAGERVLRDMPEHRALGVVQAKTSAGGLAGVLVRHIRQKSYQLVSVDAVLDLEAARTEAFLKKIRSGHHGGAGRAQGTLSVDGKAYTQRCTVTLPSSAIEAASGKGEGVLSLGLRRIAGNLARRQRERPESIPADLADRIAREGKVALVTARVYLDRPSLDVFAALGGGNLSRGIRYGVWLATHRVR